MSVRKKIKLVRDNKFTTRLTIKERKLLNRNAKSNKVTPSEFVRPLILS